MWRLPRRVAAEAQSILMIPAGEAYDGSLSNFCADLG